MNKKIKGWLDRLAEEIREEQWEPDDKWFCAQDLVDLGLSERGAGRRLKDGYSSGELSMRRCKTKRGHVNYFTEAKNAPEYTMDKQGR